MVGTSFFNIAEQQARKNSRDGQDYHNNMNDTKSLNHLEGKVVLKWALNKRIGIYLFYAFFLLFRF
jgi:hypothetical protein